MQVILFSSIAQALSSPLFGKSLTMFAPIRRADGGERARHCRPGWERCWLGTMNSRLNVLPPAASLRAARDCVRGERVGVRARAGIGQDGSLSSSASVLFTTRYLHPQGGLR